VTTITDRPAIPVADLPASLADLRSAEDWARTATAAAGQPPAFMAEIDEAYNLPAYLNALDDQIAGWREAHARQEQAARFAAQRRIPKSELAELTA
jgi:hypothetical protein